MINSLKTKEPIRAKHESGESNNAHENVCLVTPNVWTSNPIPIGRCFPLASKTSGGLAHKECCFYSQLPSLIIIGFTPLMNISDTHTIKQPPCPLYEPNKRITGGPHATTK